MLRKFTVVLCALALVAGACGSDDEEAAPAATTAAPAATTAAPAAPATTAAPAPEEVATVTGHLGDGSLGTVEVDAGEDIQIRALHAISGDVAFLGIPMTRGVEMAVSDYGDIGGHGVNVGTWLDDLCSSDGGQAAAQTIVADESVVGVLGTSCSGAATAAAPLITGSGMVLVSGSNTSPALTSDLAGTAGDNYSTGYYRTAHNDLYQGAAAAKFAVEVLGISSAAAIHDGDPYTEGLATAFADAFAALGGDVTAVTAVNKGDTDMVPVLTEVAAGSPEMLFFPIFMPEGGFIVQQVGEVSGLGVVVLMGADGLISENFMALPESEGVFMSGPDLDFAGNSNQATGQTGDGFLAAYEAEHGETPAAPFWGHAYDATTMLLDAISAASYDDGGTLVIDRAGVREYLNSIAGYSGIIGVLTCDAFGDCGSQRISVIQHNDSSDWQAGTANVVFTYNPTSSAQVGDIAAAAVDLASVCPSPIVIQTDWFPEAEHGAMYELVGDGYTIDKDNMVVRGPGQLGGVPLGIDIEIRTGGPAIGWSPVSSHVYTDDSIHFGYRSTDQQVLEFADAPMMSVVAPLEKNPQMIMWDPDTYPDVRTLADLGEQGIIINVFGGGTFPSVFVADGIWSEDQIDPSYDGSPAVFIASGGEFAQQGFASAEPYQYEHVYEEWGKPVRFQLLNDAGFPIYSQTLGIRVDDLESLRPCLELFVPVVQQAVVDYDASPDRANAIIVDAVVTFDSFWSYDLDLAAFSASAQRNLGLIGNGPDSTVGNMDPARIQAVIDKIVAAGMDVADGLTVDHLMTNEFIDMSIGFAAGAGPVDLPDLGGRVISIAVDNAYLPFSYIPADTGVAEGWDYDAMDEICYRLNCVPDFQEFVWDGTIIATGEGQFDMAAGGITITEARDEVVDFSISFISTDQKILVAKDDAEIGSRADLEAADCNVGSMTGTTNYDLSVDVVGEARIVAFESFAFAVQSLITGDVCAVIMDDVAGQGYQGANADEVSMVDEVLQADPLGFAFTEGSDLVAAFNEAIQSMKADGTLAALNGKYFGTAFTMTYDDIGDGAYAAPPLTASWRGVTESEIHIGVSMLDFQFLVDTNLSPQGWGDQQLVYETLVANLNANGGILGRELVVDSYNYYSPIGPILGGIDPEGVCLELTADHETFAVLGGFLGPVEDVNTCITGPQNTILIGGRQTTERLAQSDAPWLEPGTMKETKFRVFLSLLNAEGMLDGKTIALVGNLDDGPYDLASELLAGMDLDVVLDVVLDVAVGDTEAEDARWDVLVENVLASGAEVMMLVGGERAGVRNLFQNGIDMEVYGYNSETYTSLSESVTPEMADGDITLTGLTESEAWADEVVQTECLAPFQEANPDIVVVGPDDIVEGEEKWFQSIISYCRYLQLFAMVAEAAGPDLTPDSFLAAAESMSDFTLPGQPYNSFGPGKYDGSDSFRLSVFDADAGPDGDTLPLSAVMDGTP